MSSIAVMPSWFALYPDFSVSVAQECIQAVGMLRSSVQSARDQVLDVENVLKRDGAGEWFEEYSRQAKRVWLWLGDVHVALNQLAVAMDDTVVKAEEAQQAKEQAWAGIQRYIHPASENAKPVSAGVALRDYAFFTTREYPLQIPHLESPLTIGAVARGAVGGLVGVFSQTDTIGVDTDLVRQASVVWQDIGKTYRRALGVFEDATDAWGRECGVFAPANFTQLLESLRGFGVIAGKQAQELAHTAKRFDESQEEILGLFGWSAFSDKAWLTRYVTSDNNSEDFINILITQYGLSPESAQTIADLEQAINEKYPNASQTYRNWLLTRTLASISSDYRGYEWDQTAGILPLTAYANTVAGIYPYTMTLDEFVIQKLGIDPTKWQKLSLEVEMQAKIVNEGTKSKAENLRDLFTVSRDRYNALYTGSNDSDFDTYLSGLIERSYYNEDTARGDFAHLMATMSANYALPLDEVGFWATHSFNGGAREVAEFSGFMGDAILMTSTATDSAGNEYKSPSFGDDDYYSDLDAENIAGRSLAKNLSVSQAMNGYYADVAKDSTVREKEFVARHGGFDNLVNKVYKNAVHPDLAAVKAGDHDAISFQYFPPNTIHVPPPRSVREGCPSKVEIYIPVTGTDNRLRDMSQVKELEPAVKYLRKIQEEIQK